MRISTGMIFDAGISAINNQTAALLHTQQQVSSGRRILSPADDPVAAARALDVTQAKDITVQYAGNQESAKSALGLEDAQLSGVSDLLARVKELAVQSGNAALNTTDRKAIAVELRARFSEMLGIANSQDSSGQYLFSGYMGGTQAFSGTVDTGVTYNGDDGQLKLQLSASRQLEVSDSGNALFNHIASGNGYFATGYAAGNAGSALIDTGTVSDPTKWNSSSKGNMQVKFEIIGGTTYYDLVDTATGFSKFTGGLSTSNGGGAGDTFTHAYTSGKPIFLIQDTAGPAFDYGASVMITGTPATTDAFTISPGSSQSAFATMSNLILSLESSSTTTAASSAKLTMDVNAALANIDQVDGNVLRVRAGIGSRLNEIDALASVTSDVNLQYQQTLSNLQDVDYTKSISDLTRMQSQLDAAQKSFLKVSQMSIFNFI